MIRFRDVMATSISSLGASELIVKRKVPPKVSSMTEWSILKTAYIRIVWPHGAGQLGIDPVSHQLCQVSCCGRIRHSR
jgi:hypothetical protein